MKVLCAISGGVDSAVCAYLLKKQGYEVIAIHLDLFGKSEDVEKAREVARSLKLPFYVLNFRESFEKEVVKKFLDAYAKGLTPNPCIVCNPTIKFGKLLTKMKELGCAKLATGHYTRIEKGKLLRGVDKEKDQSYFLSRLTSEKLKHIIFPLGSLKKSEVKKIAKKIGLEKQSEAKESAGVCFLEKMEVSDFLLKKLPKKLFKVGKIKTLDGKVVGKHRGLLLYTIGQRRGVELGGMRKPHYVVGFDWKKNELLVGENEALFGKKLKAKKLSWVGETPKDEETLLAQIRFRSEACEVKLRLKKNLIEVEFEKPQRAITPGQTIAFYKKNVCLGCGEIM